MSMPFYTCDYDEKKNLEELKAVFISAFHCFDELSLVRFFENPQTDVET